MNPLSADQHFSSQYKQVLDYVHGEELLSCLCFNDFSNPLFTIRKKRDKQLILKTILQNILQYNKEIRCWYSSYIANYYKSTKQWLESERVNILPKKLKFRPTLTIHQFLKKDPQLNTFHYSTYDEILPTLGNMIKQIVIDYDPKYAYIKDHKIHLNEKLLTREVYLSIPEIKYREAINCDNLYDAYNTALIHKRIIDQFLFSLENKKRKQTKSLERFTVV